MADWTEQISEAIERRQKIEADARQLSSERSALRQQLRANAQEIVRLLEVATANGISVKAFASLTGLQRSLLYRWRDEFGGKDDQHKRTKSEG